MLPSITHNQLKNVQFPIYPLPHEETLSYKDGLLRSGGFVIDDRNQKGDTLGKRRLQSPHKLKRFNKSIQNFIGLLESKHTTFIDFKGNIFKYNKTEFARVIFKKIRKRELKEDCTLLWLIGVDSPFVLSAPPPAEAEWAGILYFKEWPWMIYEYSRTWRPTFKKKV